MIYKCKMCGGELDIAGKENVCECPYCGTQQTIPNVDAEKTLQLYNRATFLLKSCEYDKASGIYEKIIADQGEQAEAYWGLCLCKYGIEYVDDPKTGKKIPTCHRTLIGSILKDANYLKAIELADVVAKKLYHEEAKYIDSVQKKILDISKSEEPYDIFICYKETDKLGKRTPDSVIAEEIYDALTEKGYRVFFSKISLEDKIGQEYEPFIFAALTSSKVMLAIGTREEYFNAPWVRNEWSRYLKLCNSGEKKYLIPCYKDISPYEMPEEFVNLQSQDLGKLGFIQDLTKGIDKLFNKNVLKDKPRLAPKEDDLIHKTYKELRTMLLLINNSSLFNHEEFSKKWSLLYSLEDPRDTLDPNEAPLAMSCNFLEIFNLPDFNYRTPKQAFDKDQMWYIEDIDLVKLSKKEPELAAEIKDFLCSYEKERENLELLRKYNEAMSLKQKSTTPDDFLKLANLFAELGDYRDSSKQAEFYKKKANFVLDSSFKEFLYGKLINRISKYNTESERKEIVSGLEEISDYKDVEKYLSAFNVEDPIKMQNNLELLQSRKHDIIDGNPEISNFKNLIAQADEHLKKELDSLEEEFLIRKNQLDKEVSDIKDELAEAKQKLSNCGLFAIKEKKIIKEKIAMLEAELVKVKRENGRDLNELELKFTSENAKLKEETATKIKSLDSQISSMINNSPELIELNLEIEEIKQRLVIVQNSAKDIQDSLKLWNPSNISIFKDEKGFELLIFKIGRYPQTQVKIPSLIREIENRKPDQFGIYKTHGLEFVKENKKIYIVEPIEWRFLKRKDINGKYVYLLISRYILDTKSAMLPQNVVKVEHKKKAFDYYTKNENEYVSIYKYSDIRKWLIGDFYSFAFNENEKKLLCDSLIKNTSDTMADEVTEFVSEDLKDKVFNLSYKACKKMPFANSYCQDTLFNMIGIEQEEYLEELAERENDELSDVLYSLPDDLSMIPIKEYNEEMPHMYWGDEMPEYLYLDGRSDYAFDKETKKYQNGILLRSPDTENTTGYNISTCNKVNEFGGQFENGDFDVVNDIAPCIIIALDGEPVLVEPDTEFDF